MHSHKNIKSKLLSSLLLLASISGALCVSLAEAEPEPSQEQPNIILIVADDLGWHDVGFMGNSYIETPTLDKLAAEGAVFTQAYANAPNCAPSRAALITGLYAPRTEMYTMVQGDMGEKQFQKKLTPPNKVYLEPSFTTLAEVLKQQGYYTAHIGKWNLGTGEVRGPEGQGFDKNIGGYRGGPDSYFAPYGKDLPGLQQAPAGEYLTERLSEEAIAVIKEQAGKQPFFIYLAHFAPHYPIEAPISVVEKYENKKQQKSFAGTDLFPPYAAMVDVLDVGIQQILDALKQQNLMENTLIVFTSDNGSYARDTDMGGLRGGKSRLYEGGIRVPLLFWWPGNIQPQRQEVPVIGIDIFPTLAGSAGLLSLLNPDGENLMPLIKGESSNIAERNLYWYFPAYAAEKPNPTNDFFMQRPALVIRQQEWKLIRNLENENHELFHLLEDPGEQHNLAELYPERVSSMVKTVDQWAISSGAPLPLQDNPDYREPNWRDRINLRFRNLLGL